jgi:hypothetical protein
MRFIEILDANSDKRFYVTDDVTANGKPLDCSPSVFCAFGFANTGSDVPRIEQRQLVRRAKRLWLLAFRIGTAVVYSSNRRG